MPLKGCHSAFVPNQMLALWGLPNQSRSAKQIIVILIQNRQKMEKQQKQNKGSDGCHFHRHIFIGIENERNNNQREQTPHLKGEFCITQNLKHLRPLLSHSSDVALPQFNHSHLRT